MRISNEHLSFHSEEHLSCSGLGLLDFDIIWREAFNILTITLIRARSLRSADINGLSDPYVKIHLVPGVAKV